MDSPPTAIVEKLGRVLGSIRGIAVRIRGHAMKWNELETSALRAAFSGRLVPQDPSDEPAAVLLDRIRRTRADESVRLRGGLSAPSASNHSSNGHGAIARGDDSLDLVVAALQQGEPRLTAADIADLTNLDAAAVRQVLKTLTAAGQIRVHGKARGTAYEWIG